LKNGFLFWYKNIQAIEFQNKIAIKDMKNVQSTKEFKFGITTDEKSYKFKTESEPEKKRWMDTLNSEINKLSKNDEEKKQYDTIIDIKLKKKIIQDYYNLPKIQDGKNHVIKVTEEALQKEGYFKLKPKM
jgi:hypothetical protein